MLSDQANGTFLIRMSFLNPDEFVLSLQCDKHVHHIKIIKGRDGFRLGALQG